MRPHIKKNKKKKKRIRATNKVKWTNGQTDTWLGGRTHGQTDVRLDGGTNTD